MSWFGLALLSGLCFGSSRVVARSLLRYKGDPLLFTGIHNGIAGLLLLVIALTQGLQFPITITPWVFLLTMTLCSFLSDWLAFQSLTLIEVSISQIIDQLRNGIILVSSALLFSEPITTPKILGILLIMMGVVVTVYESASSVRHHRWGLALAVASTIFAAMAGLTIKRAIGDFSSATLASFELIGTALFCMIGSRLNIRRALNEVRLNGWGIVAAGTLFGMAELAEFMSLRFGEVSRVIPAVQSALVFGVLGGILFLGEKDRLPQKLAGTVLAVAGILLLR